MSKSMKRAFVIITVFLTGIVIWFSAVAKLAFSIAEPVMD